MDICIVCLKANVDATHRIFTTSKEWHGMQQVIKKHLNWWYLKETCNSNYNQWICQYCWQEISSFHCFYVRVENAQEQFAMINEIENVPKSSETVMAKKNENVLKNSKKAVESNQSMENIQASIIDVKNEIRDLDKPLEQVETMTHLKTDDLSDVNRQSDTRHYKIKNPIKQKTALDVKGNTEFILVVSKQDDVNIKTDTFQQPNPVQIEELSIVNVKNERVSETRNDQLKPIEQQDDEEEQSNLERSPKNNSESHYGVQFHNSIKNYLEYQEKREGIKNLYQINDEFIAKNFKLICDICNEYLADFKILKIHYQINHNIPGYATCCDKKWFKQTQLVDHIHYHKNPDFFKCPDCEKSYSTRYYFLYHIGEHKKRLSRTMECHICGVKLTTKAKLKNHISRMHIEENLKEHVCPICSRVSASFRIHKDHIKVAHDTERKHKCHLCTKAFKFPKQLREHISTHTRVALYSCPYCSETFIRSSDMYYHRKSIHPKEWEVERLKRPLHREMQRGKRKKLTLDLSNSIITNIETNDI